MRSTTVCVAVVAASLAAAAAEASSVPIQQSFQMPMHVRLDGNSTQCDNSPGPYITFGGQVEMEGLGVEMTFSNNAKGTHTYADDRTVEAAVVPVGQTVAIPKQPVMGGVGGNPFIWIQMTDGDGRPLSSEVYLGRCVQGALHADADISLPVVAEAQVSASDCSNNPGPYITLDGGLELSALNGRLIFRNNDNP